MVTLVRERGQRNEKQKNTTAGYQGPVKMELFKGASIVDFLSICRNSLYIDLRVNNFFILLFKP